MTDCGRPDLVALDPDDYAAKRVGKTRDGRQYFLTTPFDPAIGGKPGREFVALYLFDARGTLVDARIDDLGPREQVSSDSVKKIIADRLAEIGPCQTARITIAPFSVERFGTRFGFIVREPEDEDDWAIEVQPGNYMAFFPPWDSGVYDT